MSIVFIDDILFNDKDEVRKIRFGNCIFFLILNCLSILSGLFYLYFYFIIPYYQNSSNSLSLYLSIFHLISNIFYFIIFFELCVYKPIELSFVVKIVTMFNPLIIFCIYYWTACLTHNLYVTYYNYIHNINKRIKFYKYLLFVSGLIFYIYILLNIQYIDSQLMSKTFSLINNYNESFIDIFYIFGLIIIIYIIIKIYYILTKKEDFISVNEYQESQERNEKIKNIFCLLITRNISFIIYFLVTFTPQNIVMIFKHILLYENMNTYFIDFITILLISFSGTFLICIRLSDPLMRAFILNLITWNREFISNYKEQLLKEKSLNESFISNNISDIYNAQDDLNFQIRRNKKKSKTIAMKTISFNFGKTKNENNENRNKKFGISYVIDKKANTSGNFEIDSEKGNFEMSSNFVGSGRIDSLNELEEKYYENEEDETGKNEKDSTTNKNINNSKTNSISESEKERNDSQQNKTKNSLFINSFGSIDKKQKIINNNNNNSNNNNIPKIRNYSIASQNRKNSTKSKTMTISIRSRFKPSLRKANSKSLISQRANSTTLGLLQNKRGLGLKKRRSNSKLNEAVFHEEISSFALMNYHLEINDNLIRLIAISLAINECRMYDDIKEYQKYYNSTIPWNNKDFYKERSLFKEYNEKNIPSWLGIKNDIKCNNIQFKILSFSPFVFHHIRLIDNISIDDILSSLDPINNMKKIKSMKVSGGRGNNSIINTWDKKLIIKTVDTTERKILIEKMIIDYHCLMKESRSLLSRIYGIFKIELQDKGTINVMVQRNMNDLPIYTKLLAFDFKGSTVDRQVISDSDTKLNKEELALKYKNKVLKDIDLGILDMKFIINYNDWQQLMSIIDSDSMFLQNYEVTDYSLLVFVHKYRKEDIIKNKDCNRIIPSKDHKYIFNFSIVDFLGPFNFEKKGEKLAKELVGYIKKLKDTNFSVLDPNRYAKRFRNFVKRTIIDG